MYFDVYWRNKFKQRVIMGMYIIFGTLAFCTIIVFIIATISRREEEQQAQKK